MEYKLDHGKSLLIRVVSMLSRLVDRFSSPSLVREDPARYGIEDEDEDEDDSAGAEDTLK